jgi:hypothetical protein
METAQQKGTRNLQTSPDRGFNFKERDFQLADERLCSFGGHERYCPTGEGPVGVHPNETFTKVRRQHLDLNTTARAADLAEDGQRHRIAERDCLQRNPIEGFRSPTLNAFFASSKPKPLADLEG